MTRTAVVPLFLVASISILSGCTTSRQRPNDCTAQKASWNESAVSMQHRVEKAVGSATTHDQALVLSGGGAWGAYGAGYLTAKFSTSQPVNYTLVTGVSTGAVMATAAFIGDTKMLELYSLLSEKQIVEKKLFWIFRNSYVSTKPLRKLLEKQLSESVIRQVAQKAADSNAVLLIGAYDLDDGEFRTFDLTELSQGILSHDAAERKMVQRLYVDAVMASAAIPVAFPPVFIDCHMHVDGGVGHQLFIEHVVSVYKNKAVDATSTGTGQRPTLLAIVNGRTKLTADSDGIDNGLIPIAARSFSGLLRSSVQNDLRILEHYSDASVYNLTIASADNTQCREPGGVLGFDRVFMKCLYEEGQRDGKAQPLPPTSSTGR